MGNFKYKESFGIVVVCETEKEQIEIYEKLEKEGYNLKVVAI